MSSWFTTRTSEWYHTLKPQTEYHSWLVDKIAVYSLRIDRAERMERRLRDRKAMVAELGWEDDRRLDAEALGSKLALRPAEVVEKLRQTPAGCDWLICRWAMLARLAEVNDGVWTADQTSLAFHLLGTPLELREGLRPGDWVVQDGGVQADNSMENLASLARRESAALTERRESITGLDEVDRALTEADLFDESHPELKRLRRHESTLHNRLRWCLKQLEYQSPHRSPHPDLKPAWRPTLSLEPEPSDPPPPADRQPAEATGPKPLENPKRCLTHPPFCLEPDEIPVDLRQIDPGAIAISREVERLKKADARREARRRKLERRRA